MALWTKKCVLSQKDTHCIGHDSDYAIVIFGRKDIDVFSSAHGTGYIRYYSEH
jgi:hypothetical protein